MYCDWLSEEEIQIHQCSDRVWAPKKMFERWLLEEDAGAVVIVNLHGIPACMYGPHSGEGNVLYVPDWMCAALHVSGEPDDQGDDYITPMRGTPNMCTFVKVKPTTSAHIDAAQDLDEPAEDILSRGFEQYTCIRQGQVMNLRLPTGEVLEVVIEEAKPENNDFLCIRSGEIEMELLPPTDLIEKTLAALSEPPLPEPPVPEPELPTTHPTHHSTHFQGEGHVLSSDVQTVPESREERRKRMAEAATARLNAAKAAV